MKIIDKILGKKKKFVKAKVLEVGFLEEASHTYIITLEEDSTGNKISIGFTDDAEAAAFAIGYTAKLQDLLKGKYSVCLQINKYMVNFLIGKNDNCENMQALIKIRNNGEKKAEQDAKYFQD